MIANKFTARSQRNITGIWRAWLKIPSTHKFWKKERSRVKKTTCKTSTFKMLNEMTTEFCSGHCRVRMWADHRLGSVVCKDLYKSGTKKGHWCRAVSCRLKKKRSEAAEQTEPAELAALLRSCGKTEGSWLFQTLNQALCTRQDWMTCCSHFTLRHKSMNTQTGFIRLRQTPSVDCLTGADYTTLMMRGPD